MHGYTGLVGGAFLLLGLSLFKGVLELAWGYFFSQPASCTVKEFYTLSGGLGCANIPVAACYSFIIYGILNLVVTYGRRAS